MTTLPSYLSQIRRPAALLVMGLLAALMTLAAFAQTYPSKPIRLVLRSAPGGGDDLHARLLAPHLQEILGQPVVIDYRTGAGGLVAWEMIAKAPPDGYTIMLTASGLTSIRSLRPNVTIDPWRDYVWVSLFSRYMLVLSAHPVLPVKNLKELVTLARKRPGELSYGSSGVGATPHLAVEYFKAAAKLDILHVPYKGGGPMFQDLLGGRVDLGTSTPAPAIPHIRNGKIRALGVTGANRLHELPEVQTIAEGAGLPGFEFTGFYAIIAPAGTPGQIVTQLSEAVIKTVATPGFKDRFRKLVVGIEPTSSTPEQTLMMAKEDAAKASQIVRSANIKLD